MPAAVRQDCFCGEFQGADGFAVRIPQREDAGFAVAAAIGVGGDAVAQGAAFLVQGAAIEKLDRADSGGEVGQ